MHVNNDYQRNANISKIFETVWKNPNFSRIDIARSLDLYRSTVSNIIGTLVESELICEGERGSATEKGGRKPVFRFFILRPASESDRIVSAGAYGKAGKRHARTDDARRAGCAQRADRTQSASRCAHH